MDGGGHDPLAQIVGEQLSEVTFVQDYVQLAFDGPRLTAITCPRVFVSGRWFNWGEAGYRDALCGQIAKVLRAGTTHDGQEIRLEFMDDTVISISLRDEGYRGPEAAYFVPIDKTTPWTFWRGTE